LPPLHWRLPLLLRVEHYRLRELPLRLLPVLLELALRRHVRLDLRLPD
jgi:hypothetical protein